MTEWEIDTVKEAIENHDHLSNGVVNKKIIFSEILESVNRAGLDLKIVKYVKE